MIRIVQGETLIVTLNVVDTEGVEKNLSGATATFAYKGIETPTQEKPCQIEGNSVTATLLPAETSDLKGRYRVEVKIKDIDNNVDMVHSTRLEVYESIIPNF